MANSFQEYKEGRCSSPTVKEGSGLSSPLLVKPYLTVGLLHRLLMANQTKGKALL